jgi:hypothetical protein
MGPDFDTPEILSPLFLLHRNQGMWVIHLALSLAALYAAIIAGMYFAQTWFIFPTILSRATRVHLPESAQHLKVRTPDGENLMGVRIPGTGAKIDGSPSLLGFAGNAWNAETMVLILHRLFPIAVSLGSTTAVIGRAAAGPALRRCFRVHLWPSTTCGRRRPLNLSLRPGLASGPASPLTLLGIDLSRG